MLRGQPHPRGTHFRPKFLEAGVRAGYIDCFTKDEARRETRRKFAGGEYEVVVNVDVLTMGVDWDVRCIILARPTKSEMRFVQAVGRGLRPADGKHCLILDHSDTTSRLGFVTDIHHNQLDDGKTRQSSKRDHVRLPKECPMCACLRPIHTNVCPNCGFVAKPVNKVRTVAGELRELSKSKIIDRDQVVGELKAIAMERGWKPGAVYFKYKEYSGEDLPRSVIDRIPVQSPSSTIRRWVKSRIIAFAKGKARGPAFTNPIGGFYQSKDPEDVPF